MGTTGWLHGPAKGPGKGWGNGAPSRLRVGYASMENHDPEEQAFRTERKKIKRERRDLSERVLLREAMQADESRDRSFAADRLLVHLGPESAKKFEISGPDGKPMQTIGINTTDPVEAARVYQQIISGGDDNG